MIKIYAKYEAIFTIGNINALILIYKYFSLSCIACPTSWAAIDIEAIVLP